MGYNIKKDKICRDKSHDKIKIEHGLRICEICGGRKYPQPWSSEDFDEAYRLFKEVAEEAKKYDKPLSETERVVVLDTVTEIQEETQKFVEKISGLAKKIEETLIGNEIKKR